jgi:hypothetical protein
MEYAPGEAVCIRVWQIRENAGFNNGSVILDFIALI